MRQALTSFTIFTTDVSQLSVFSQANRIHALPIYVGADFACRGAANVQSEEAKTLVGLEFWHAHLLLKFIYY